MKPPRGLVMDFGGVLTENLNDRLFASAAEAGLDAHAVVQLVKSAYENPATESTVVSIELGTASVADFESSLAGVLANSASSARAAGFVSRLITTLGIEEEMFGAARHFREAGVRTAVLSNSWGSEGYPWERLEEAFDVVVLSGEVGMRKPDRGIYVLTAERMGLHPADCVFVDDFEVNVRGAAQAGMLAMLHTSADETLARLAVLFGSAGTEGSAPGPGGARGAPLRRPGEG